MNVKTIKNKINLRGCVKIIRQYYVVQFFIFTSGCRFKVRAQRKASCRNVIITVSFKHRTYSGVSLKLFVLLHSVLLTIYVTHYSLNILYFFL